MPDIKLAKLPDRTPVKITVTLKPDLNTALQSYATLYSQAYGEQETVADLIPYILESFLEGDRNFAKAIKEGDVNATPMPAQQGRRRRRRDDAEGQSETTS